jgi:hypothetical protein
MTRFLSRKVLLNSVAVKALDYMPSMNFHIFSVGKDVKIGDNPNVEICAFLGYYAV